MNKIKFATGNEGKLEEIGSATSETGYELEQVEVDIHEIDAADVEEVARQKAVDSRAEAVENGDVESGEWLMVEDTGFYVEAIGGFPGSHAGFFSRTVGAEKLLTLLEDAEDRSAYFKTSIVLYNGEEMEVFNGELHGEVPLKERGEPHPHLPYNSLFIPENSDNTIAENSGLKKNNHRARAVDRLVEHLNSI